MLSHVLSRTFHQHEKVVLVRADLTLTEIEEMEKRWWFLRLSDFDREEMRKRSVCLEDFLLYRIAFLMGPDDVVPDLKQYRPEVHDDIIRAGLAVDMYAIPSLFGCVEVQTGTILDKEITDRMLKFRADWQERLETLKRAREAELARVAREKELLERGELLPADAVKCVESVSPSLGCDYTEPPVYPATRRDLAAVRRSVENGSSYGYDIIYLVWRTVDGIKAKKLADSSFMKDYIHIRSIAETDSGVSVEVGSGGSYSGTPFDKRFTVSFSELDAFDGEKPLSGKLDGLSQGLGAWQGLLDASAGKFWEVMREQLARMSSVLAGEKTKGREMLDDLYGDTLQRLISRYPTLGINIFRLESIAEVYPEKLEDTFSLIDVAEDERAAWEIAHILGEMAMMKNDSDLYERLVVVLQKRINDPDALWSALSDDRFEFQLDETIAEAIKEYE